MNSKNEKRFSDRLNRHGTRKFSGQGRFLGRGAHRQRFHVRHTKEEPHRETFFVLFLQDDRKTAF